MFRHVVLWKFEDDAEPGLKRELAITIKAGLEELAFVGHGVVKMDVHIDPLPGREDGADILVDSAFESRDAYEAYLEHPARLAVMKLVEDHIDDRLSMDFRDEEQG